MSEVIEFGRILNPGATDSRIVYQPLIMGYTSFVMEEKSNLNAGAGGNILTGTACPAGYIWQIEAIACINNNTNPTRAVLYAKRPGFTSSVPVRDGPGAGAGVWFAWTGIITLIPTMYIETYIAGCAAGDDIFLIYSGRAIEIKP